jgi:hypothetical protein
MKKHSTPQTPRVEKPKFAAFMLKTSSQGSITMEYIVVSSFALLVSVSAVTWIGKLVKARIDNLSAKLGTDAGDFDVSLDPIP